MTALYQVVPGSLGIRRAFQVVFGLVEGYGKNATVFKFKYAVELAKAWMTEKAEEGAPFLTGIFSPGEVTYAWAQDGIGQARSEPVAIFSGEVSTLYRRHLTDTEVMQMLNEFAAYIGKYLKQSRVYVSYRDNSWVLQAQESETPTGEIVG